MIFFFLLLCVNLISNPFEINFPTKETLTFEDYVLIQKQLDEKKQLLDPWIHAYYQKSYDNPEERLPESLFYSRVSRALNGNFFDLESAKTPKVECIKINQGSDFCIVSAAPCRGRYYTCLQTQIDGLKNSGFKGYHLSFWGAYPNPTGKEIRYSGVPYAMKVFAMLEAQKLGFNKVIWMDAAWVPLKDPTPLFKDLDRIGALYTTIKPEGWHPKIKGLPQETANILKTLTGVDVMEKHIPYVATCVVAFKMDHPLVQKFIRQYYTCVAVGAPFVSFFPEEYVFTAILGQKQFKKWQTYNQDSKAPLKVVKRLRCIEEQEARENESYFYYFQHH